MPKKDLYKLADGRELRCGETVRLLPEKREACLGTLEGRPAFIKIFLDANRGKIHWHRELDGVRALQQRGILTAELLYAGMVGNNNLPLIVFVQLSDPVTLQEALDGADHAASQQLLEEMTTILAGHHMAGVCQTDLHLNNFVISEDKIYTLDGAGIIVTEGEFSLQQGLDNLALFLAQLAPRWVASAPKLYRHYLAQRGQEQGPGSDYLARQIELLRRRRWDKYKGKLFRDCTSFRYRKSSDRLEIVATRHLSPELDSLLSDPDGSLVDGGQVLKKGNTCTVWTTDVAVLRLVVKRYNVKGLWHGIKLGVWPSRAFRSWKSAHRLLFHGISTPAPVAVLKRGRQGLRPVTYFFMEYIDGVGAHSWFLDAAVTTEEKSAVAAKIASLFRQLMEQRISHGDMKASNIMVVGNEVMLIDLDSMHRHVTTVGLRRAWRSDLRRFMANWDETPELAELFRQALHKEQID
jgi:tRNA A-37 threonylcarbamoyl transferase component Bud32